MKTQTVLARAKINLFLDVTSKRSDGYHNIDSVMQTVSLNDNVIVTVSESDGGIKIYQEFINSDLPCDQTNLCYKAAMAYLKHFLITDVTICIKVVKEIPCQAGLAGGSADAAAVIKALDLIFNRSDSIEALCSIGLQVGSDVPFCVMGGTCSVQGRGEILTQLSNLPHYYIVVAKSENDSVSTKEAYNRIDNSVIKDAAEISFDDYVKAVMDSDKDVIENGVYNIFQNVMTDSLDETKKIIEIIKNSGAVATLMSGSGPSVFGLFDDEREATKALDDLSKNYFAVMCEPV